MPHHVSCLQQPCCCFIAGYGGNFRKFLSWDRRQLKSFSLHPRKQRPSSPLCISILKRWVSGRPLHDTPILDLESELCASQTIGSHPKLTHHWWAPHHATVACTLRRHFISYLTRWCWLARRQASCMRGRNLVLRFEKRKHSDESRVSDDRRRSWANLLRRTSIIFEGQRNRHSYSHANRTSAIAATWLGIKKKSRLIARYQTFPLLPSFPGILVYSLWCAQNQPVTSLTSNIRVFGNNRFSPAKKTPRRHATTTTSVAGLWQMRRNEIEVGRIYTFLATGMVVFATYIYVPWQWTG